AQPRARQKKRPYRRVAWAQPRARQKKRPYRRVARAQPRARQKKRPYRRGVGAVLFDKRGRVFVARRLDTPGPAWQLPQGGVDAGESPRSAIRRELAEEIGTDRARIVGAIRRLLAYDLPPALAARSWGGRYRGQKQKWFALRFTGRDSDIRLDADASPEFGAWKWARLEDLPGLAVAFKRPVYRALAEEFRRFAKPVRAAKMASGKKTKDRMKKRNPAR
ncbi:MAG: RNA pyrophosphohydrolase, partial [Rhodospirillales bacterium]|nr:RNA pyrophosphohydrolase [Rhodospirillales bacterium]